MSENSDSEYNLTPPDILEAATSVTNNLLPAKSRKLYDKIYSDFMSWKLSKKATSFSENVLLAYFQDLSETFKCSSLWVKYSMLKSTLSIYNEIDITKYSKLIAYLKRKSQGYKGKKSKTFTADELNKFLSEAPDKLYLSTKDEPTSSGDSGDESGSEPESPGEKRPSSVNNQDWCIPRSPDTHSQHREPQASTSSQPQEADSSKPVHPKILPKLSLPDGAMLYHPSMLAGVGLEGLGSNLGLGNLAMGYPHSFILGLANQGQDGASSSSSSSQPQFITIPLSMAMAAAAGRDGSSSSATGNGQVNVSSDDSSELQDLSTGARK